MSNANRDGNFVPTAIGALNTDGKTITLLKADPTTHGLLVSNGTSGTDHGPTVALKDDNGVSAWMAASSTGGTIPVVVYVDSSGQLLIQNT